MLVADKGTDQIQVYRLGAPLRLVHTAQLPPQTGPRHIAFDPISHVGYLTCEFVRLGKAAHTAGMSGSELLRQGAPALPWVAGNLLRRGKGTDALVDLLPLRAREAVWTARRLLRR